ncbi:MAG: hypothetical protein AAGJ82_07300 [Bacteroidota bacterium]
MKDSSMPATPYVPIDCQYNDRLLDHATLRSRIKLAYQTANGSVEITTVIKDVYTQEGAEYLLTQAGEVIRLDQLLAVDEVTPPTDSHCAL